MKISEFTKLTKQERKLVPFNQLPWPNKYIPLIVLAFIIFGLGTCVRDSINNPTPEVKSVDTLMLQVNAKTLAEQSVKLLLKSPSSAEFPSEEQNFWFSADSIAIVKGAVDAQNTFGAMLRTTFYVKLKWTGDSDNISNWLVLDARLDE